MDSVGGFKQILSKLPRSIEPSDQKYRSERGLKPNDRVTVYKLPKGKAGSMLGGFCYTPLSVRAKTLNQSRLLLESKMTRLKTAPLSLSEKSAEMRKLKCKLCIVNRQLNMELASLPQNVIIVEEF